MLEAVEDGGGGVGMCGVGWVGWGRSRGGEEMEVKDEMAVGQRGRQTDRQTDRPRDRQRGGQIDKQTDRQRQTNKETESIHKGVN